MKQFFLLLTISIAFAASVLARASEIPATDVVVPLQKASYNEKTRTMKLMGQLTNPCQASPRPELSPTEVENVVILDVVAWQAEATCATVMHEKFELAFDVHSLRHNLTEINKNPKGQYKIITRNGELAVEVNFADAVAAPEYASEQVAGGVFAVENNGRFVVVVSPEEAFEMNSPFIDMSKYVGQKVTVQGHIMNNRKPGMNFDRGVQKVFPAILVTGINTNAL